MKVGIISYSLTGNNETLASGLASAFGAEHIRISETRARSMRTSILDMLFNRIPQINFHFTEVSAYELIVFVGPVWAGKVASPFRACFRQLQSRIGNYAFVSISGGAMGANPKLSSDLVKWLKKIPISVIDLHIADLLPKGKKPKATDTSAYRISKDDARKLTATVETELRKIIG